MLRMAVGLRHIIFHERPEWIYTLYEFEEMGRHGDVSSDTEMFLSMT